MATLDQLPAEQRAIVELVVQRGRSYDALADVLQVPSERVRELARDALSELSPRTASRVDPAQRGEVADYLLGQQSPEDARATRDYLKRSEPARAWALSLLDSLDPLYANGSQPAVPEPNGEPVVAAPVAAEPEPAAQKPEPAAAAAETAEDRVRARERERTRRKPVVTDEPDEEAATEPKREREPARAGAALSPAAQAALRRRRIIGATAGLAVLAAIVVAVLAIAGAFSSDSKKSSAASPGTTTPGTSTTAQPQVQVLGQIALTPIGKTRAQGIAYVVQQGTQRYIVVQAQVPPLPNNQKVAAYEVWLYNSNADARSLGAQYTNAQGVLQGRAPLPADVTKFKAIDISRELFADKNAGHGNSSVLRGTFASLKPVPQQPQQGTTPTGP
jgi:DNA-directed RNA polymerase specialized sigma24 family protein